MWECEGVCRASGMRESAWLWPQRPAHGCNELVACKRFSDCVVYANAKLLSLAWEGGYGLRYDKEREAALQVGDVSTATLVSHCARFGMGLASYGLLSYSE